jgi:hypothetical protein
MTMPRMLGECAALHLVCDDAAARAAASPPPGMTDPDYDKTGVAFVELIGPSTVFSEWLRRKSSVGLAGEPYVAVRVARVPCVRVWVLGTETGGRLDTSMRPSMAAARAYAAALEDVGFEVFVDGIWFE